MGIFRRFLLICAIGLSVVAPAARAAQAAPIEVRLVIVTAFEIGADTGDRAGEFQAWAETMPEVLPFPAGFRDLRYDAKREVLLLHTGIGTSRAAASVTALGMDPRFDLSHAYWLVAAIAGVDPATASVGSAAWIGDIVDTDYGYAVDPREAPAGWSTGMFPRDRAEPYLGPRGDPQYNLFALNKPLRDWAYALTRDIPLADSEALQSIRAPYSQYSAARRPPHVLKGAEASGQTFWHGTLLNDHVRRWVRYWTDGGEPFVMTGMEDTGVAGALHMLGRTGRVDPARLLVLRTGSNYSVPPPGVGAAQSLTAEAKGLSALQPSLDAAFLVGGRVVDEITVHWSRYRDRLPGAVTEAPAE
ncbi:MAG: purine nucleoside permease [Sphingomonas sp.]|uniref:purine-nucleoside phosphorylase n=1 Tax=Sphingomonas sp. TaxID=28214 RepID=UPI0022768697|nr:purine nucleoside permease [Sphingomonas sp.]MCX8475754.1 purine nucleoside permease [Sphingomonas sp.]